MKIISRYNSKNLSTQNVAIVSKIQHTLKNFYQLESIVSELPTGAIIVGGFIRDLALGRLSEYPDIDIVVPNDASKVGRNIAKKFSGKFLMLDADRNIVRIIFKDYIIDIANQTHKILVEDLKSRDFTINSIGFSIDTGKLIDPTNGLNDINNHLLKSFYMENLIYDPLRILRCFRFISELNFHIDPNLHEFIKLNKLHLKEVSVERIQYELKKIVHGKEALKTVGFLNKIKIFDWAQSYENNYSDVLSFLNFDNFSKDEIDKYFPIFYLRELLKEPVLKKFKFSKSDIYTINLLRRWSKELQQKSINDFTEIERYQLHKDLEMILPAFILYMPKKYHREWLQRWRNKKDKLFHPRNYISGNQLKNLIDIKDGPLLGDLINYLSREFAYGRLNDFDEAIYKAKGWFQQNAPKCD